MTMQVCPYTRLIEPLRDGVPSSQAESLETHLGAGCALCQAEVVYLDWLAAELRRRTPVIDEVSVQRERTPLLAQAESQRRRWQSGRQQRLGAVKGAVAVFAVAAMALLLYDRSPRVSVARVAGSGDVRRYTEGERSIVQLNDGRYELKVSRGVLDRSLLVRLPDGEIEDLGTAFSVTVEEGHTLRVDVTEGAVQLRLRGAPHLTLQAGNVWEAPAPLNAEEGRAREASSAHDIGSSAPDASPPLERKQRALSSTKALKRVTVDSKTEDAMYLRILDLLRADREDVARRMAQRYLKEFPDGFRRSEIMNIAYPAERPPSR